MSSTLSSPQFLRTFDMHLLWTRDLFRMRTTPLCRKIEHIVAIAVNNGEWGALQKSQVLNGSPRELLTGKVQKEVLETGLSEKMVTYLAVK